jgi:hypothetical protein
MLSTQSAALSAQYRWNSSSRRGSSNFQHSKGQTGKWYRLPRRRAFQLLRFQYDYSDGHYLISGFSATLEESFEYQPIRNWVGMIISSSKITIV